MYIRPPVPADAKWDEILRWEGNRFGLFVFDENRRATDREVSLTAEWGVSLRTQDELVRKAMDELDAFLKGVMGVELRSAAAEKNIAVSLGGGDEAYNDSFTLDIDGDGVRVAGRSAEGAFCGIMHLINLMGLSSAPVLPVMSGRICWPSLRVRCGSTRYTPQNMTFAADLFNGLSPKMDADAQAMELRRLGYNEMWISSDELSYVAQSSVLPEIQDDRAEERIRYMAERAEAAHRHGMKAVVCISAWRTYPAGHPIFSAHPGLKGATKLRTVEQGPDKKDDEPHHTLCTESETGKRFIYESIRNIFTKADVDKLLVLVGGEHFHHCFMRPLNRPKGHTDCPVCEALGAETVVSDLVGLLSAAVRSVKPEGEVVFWPYSASWAWSKENDQKTFIGMMKGSRTALLTELEKDVWIRKGGYSKNLWDYSFDQTYCTEKGRAQIEYCHGAGIRVYLKSEPKLPLEMIHALYLPCLDRFADRYFAIVASGADGVYNIDAFVSRPHALSQLLAYFMWMEPNASREKILCALANMLAANNETAAAHIRRAWVLFSEALGYFPLIPRYVVGPSWLGPSHPLILDRGKALDDKFYTIEATLNSYSDSYRPREPIFLEEWENGYYQMRDWNECALLGARALAEMDRARAVLGEKCSSLFLLEWTTLKHLCLTVRTCRNTAQFYLNRDRIIDVAGKGKAERGELGGLIDGLSAIAEDELDCARADEECLIYNPWNDYRHQSDGPVCHRALEILREKIRHTQWLLQTRLPEYRKELAGGASGETGPVFWRGIP
jgi:hypothetical protein